ncbi:hypothetical protein B484DRAFT_408153 [Ochromonadaceae sp. CCMP2298]|nr:hypothetical protein B484DRAFT_408153 [Ochromonadaceae sp. CCMP2298]
MAYFLNVLSALLAVVSLGLLLAATASWSSDQYTIEENFWVEGSGKFFFALTGLSVRDEDVVFKYEDCSSYDDLCEKCEEAGTNTFAFLLVACVLCPVNVVLNGCSIDGAVSGWVAVCASLAAALFAMAAFVAFVGSDCYDMIDGAYDNVKYGPSAIYVLASLCLLAVGTLFGIIAALSTSTPTAASGYAGDINVVHVAAASAGSSDTKF